MPFQSKKQQRWAFATGQPWAKEWADKTDFKKLPLRMKKKKVEEAFVMRPAFTAIIEGVKTYHMFLKGNTLGDKVIKTVTPFLRKNAVNIATTARSAMKKPL
jgi:hypothetical protein